MFIVHKGKVAFCNMVYGTKAPIYLALDKLIQDGRFRIPMHNLYHYRKHYDNENKGIQDPEIARKMLTHNVTTCANIDLDVDGEITIVRIAPNANEGESKFSQSIHNIHELSNLVYIWYPDRSERLSAALEYTDDLHLAIGKLWETSELLYSFKNIFVVDQEELLNEIARSTKPDYVPNTDIYKPLNYTLNTQLINLLPVTADKLITVSETS